MGAGASDLSMISPSTLFQEVKREYQQVIAQHDTAVAGGAIASDKEKELESTFESLKACYGEYVELYKEKEDKKDPVVIEKAVEVNERYREYRDMEQMLVMKVGDIVQVRDSDMAHLFVEGIVFGIDGKEVQVKLTDPDFDEEEDVPLEDVGPHDQWVTVSVDSNDIRKVKPWDCLEVGDRVRVKEGGLFFQGTVIAVSSDGEKITVNCGDDFDRHQLEEEEKGDRDDESDDEGDIDIYPRHLVEKIDTKRVTVMRFKDYVRRVQKSLFVSKAFRDRNGSITTSDRDANEAAEAAASS